MAKYIQTNLRYQKIMEEGTAKKVSEQYLVRAELCSEAEKRVSQEMKPLISGDFQVSAVSETKILKVVRNNGGNKFWKVKVAIEDIDTEKLSSELYLVEADDCESAIANFKDAVEMGMGTWYFSSISETKILDVYE